MVDSAFALPLLSRYSSWTTSVSELSLDPKRGLRGESDPANSYGKLWSVSCFVGTEICSKGTGGVRSRGSVGLRVRAVYVCSVNIDLLSKN